MMAKGRFFGLPQRLHLMFLLRNSNSYKIILHLNRLFCHGLCCQAPVVQSTPQYDTTKTYYTPIANVTPGAAASATVYALPTDATYQTNKFQSLYDSTKKYYPVAPVAAPPAAPTTMYTVTAEPIYQTREFQICCH